MKHGLFRKRYRGQESTVCGLKQVDKSMVQEIAYLGSFARARNIAHLDLNSCRGWAQTQHRCCAQAAKAVAMRPMFQFLFGDASVFFGITFASIPEICSRTYSERAALRRQPRVLSQKFVT